MTLSNKEIEKRVKAFTKNKNANSKTEQLPLKFRKIMFGLRGCEENGKSLSGQKSFQTMQAQKNALNQLSRADRTKLFKQLRPRLATAIELTWKFFEQLPIENNESSGPFRAPNDSGLLVDRRTEWLTQFIDATKSYDDQALTPQWLAAWTVHLATHGNWWIEELVSPLLAAVISKGDKTGKEVLEILIQSANREHEIGVMGQFIPVTLLMANNEGGWEFTEKLLLAAQRQEGLRQSILNGMHDAHPAAAKRMYKLMVDHKLARFSSVTQFLNGHLNYHWDSASVGVVNKVLDQCGNFLGNSSACQKAIDGDDAESAFLSMWAIAVNDVEQLGGPIKKLLKNPNVEMRYVAAKMLALCPSSPKFKGLHAHCYQDDDIRVAMAAIPNDQGYYNESEEESVGDKASFEALEKLLEKMPKKASKQKPIVWPWAIEVAQRETVGGELVKNIGKLPPIRLIPHLKSLPPHNRRSALAKIIQAKTWTSEIRTAIVESLGDAAEDVQSEAFRALKNRKLTPDEIERIEGYLTRKSNELRTRVVYLLMKQKEPDMIRSAQRLLNKGNLQQRLGGFEILRQLAESGKQLKLCSEIVGEWKENRNKITSEETIQCNSILESGKPPITLENGLGFFDPNNFTPGVRPKNTKTRLTTPATHNLVAALDKLIHENRKTMVSWSDWDNNPAEGPLTTAVFKNPDPKIPMGKQKDQLPLADVWFKWFEDRPKSCRDTDRFEIERSIKLVGFLDWNWHQVSEFMRGSADNKKFVKTTLGINSKPKLKYVSEVQVILNWLRLKFPVKKLDEFRLDCVEYVCSIIPDSNIKLLATDKFKKLVSWDRSSKDFRSSSVASVWTAPSWDYSKLSRTQIKRLWQLVNWMDKPIADAERSRPDYNLTFAAYQYKFATFDDVVDQLIGPSNDEYSQFNMLRAVTMRKPAKHDAQILQDQQVSQTVGELRDRILEIELNRGEKETAATGPAMAISSIFGTDNLIAILAGLGKSKFKKTSYWSESKSKAQSLTDLAEKTFPTDQDTKVDFSKKIKAALKEGLFPEERVLELAFHAPQWGGLIEQYLNWNGMTEAMYWFLAHMSYVWGAKENVLVGTEYDEDDTRKNEGEDPNENQASGWERLILERTSISTEHRFEGAVDVQWFHQIHSALGANRFQEMAAAARYASSGAQAKRAKYIGDVLTGAADRAELIQKIHDKKLKENVRLLGLLPLAKGKKREADIQERYEILQDYQKYARGLSSLSKPDALRACEIGLENMARTAGFEDPMRMQWALEAESTKDLRAGFLEAKKDDVVMRMDMNEKGMPVTTIQRGEKPLKSLPSKYRKEQAFVEIRDRAKLLKKQSGRIRLSLENAMSRGDSIESKELKQLAGHAVLWPMLTRLVLIGDGIMGYPDKGGKALRDLNNKLEPIKAAEKLRIAHPFDLLKTKQWSDWQRECFRSERIQPFKQLFRELYVVSAQEKKDRVVSRRYAGQQVHSNQASALWSARGWQTREGVWKSFPNLGLNVDVGFEFGWGSPLEIEGLTIETVSFTKRDDRSQMKLTEVPPMVFSEIMRDMDLVVSVAHRGEVDPEASASTVEMRTMLIEETCQVLGISNVKIKKNHALIKGQHNEYSLHLGSGQVHVVPGGHVCIVPVHAQHRGRIFLPFADDDPKTAELMSKVLLLARDSEIQDPTILEQLRAASV